MVEKYPGEGITLSFFSGGNVNTAEVEAAEQF